MWLIFTLTSTLALSVRNILSKKGVDKIDPIVVAWATVFFSLPVALFGVLINGFFINDTSRFWSFLVIRVTFDVVALLCLLTALKFKGVSYVIPLLSIAPFLTALWGVLFRDQLLSLVSLMGLIVIATSCLMILFSEATLSKSSTDKSGIRKATILVLITAFLFSILDQIHPIIIEASSTYTYFFASTLIFILVFSVLAIFKAKKDFLNLFESRRKLLLSFWIGIALGIEVLFLFLALSSVEIVASVSSIRTVNIALTTLLGFILLKEKFNWTKSVGIIISMLGVLLVTFGL